MERVLAPVYEVWLKLPYGDFIVESAIEKDQDIVLIAGKGHEDYQIIREKRLFFDDRAVAKEFLQNT
jgi:hypothetical protein